MPAHIRHAVLFVTFFVHACDSGTVRSDDPDDDPPANTAPMAVDDAYQAEQDVPLTVDATEGLLANDLDAENDRLIAVVETEPAEGILTLAFDGTFTYAPNTGFFGIDGFTYRCRDRSLDSEPATVIIAVNATGNRAPVAVDDDVTTDEEVAQVIAVTANDFDPDGDALTLVATGTPTLGDIVVAGDLVTYTPRADEIGNDSFTYEITDGRGGLASGTVQVTILAVNDTPVATDPGAISVDEDTSIQIVLTGVDSEDPEASLTANVVTAPVEGTLDVLTGTAPLTVLYAPAPDYYGTDGLTFTVTDTDSATSTAINVNIDVVSVNDAPVAADDNALVEVDTATDIAVLDNDTDVDTSTLTITAVTQGTDGTVTNDGTMVTYTPGAGFVGSDAFTYTVSDGMDAHSANVTVNVMSFDGWFGLGSSEMGLWTTRLRWGSATGSGITDGHTGTSPDVAIDPSGNPLVVWDGGMNIYLRRWDPVLGVWEELDGSGSGGGLSDTVGQTEQPAMALNAAGEPAVAWTDYTSGTRRIYVKRLVAGTWQEVGTGSAAGDGVSGAGGGDEHPRIAIDSNGDPIVAWEGGPNVFARRWTGSIWENLGSNALVSVTNSASQPDLAINGDDEPIIAWNDGSSGASEIFVARWNDTATAWQSVGTASNTGVGISNGSGGLAPTVAVNSSDEPIVAWRTTSGVYVRRFNASTVSWDEVGAGSASGGGLNSAFPVAPYIAESGGKITVAWQDLDTREIHALRWDAGAGAWQELAGSASPGGISNNFGVSGEPAVAMNGNDDPVVAWQDNSVPGAIYVRRYAPAAGWEELGTGNATGGGISDSPGHSIFPSLAIEGGVPAVAWQDQSSGWAEIYVRRWSWSSATWDEVGSGSASGVGISDTESGNDPEVAFGMNGDPVVLWQDGFDGYIRHYDRTTGLWEELGAGSASGLGVTRTNDALSPKLATSPTGIPTIVWSDLSQPDRQIYMLTWDPVLGSWSGPASGGGISDNTAGSVLPALAIDSTGAWGIAWMERSFGTRITYQHATDSDDNFVKPTTTDESSYPSLVFDDNDAPWVAWEDDANGNNEIYVKRYNTTSTLWEELAGSATGSGISNTAGNSYRPGTAIRPNGDFVVTWQDDSSGIDEIYVRYWNETGGSWDELHTGSATGGGISNSNSASIFPRVAADDLYLCIAWGDAGGSATQIVLRCTR